jgi:gamma-tubulin complex component 3
MLYFLHELSDLPLPLEQLRSRDPRGGRAPEPTTPSKKNAPAPAVTSPAFRDAFARPGLAQVPVNTGSPKAVARPVPVVEKPEKPKVRRSQDTSKEPQADAGHAEKPDLGPTEPALLRDLPFTLQGLSSTNLTFPTSTALKLPATLPVPIISLLHTLAEPAILYRGLAEFVESADGGLIGQSFRSALAKELRAYWAW